MTESRFSLAPFIRDIGAGEVLVEVLDVVASLSEAVVGVLSLL